VTKDHHGDGLSNRPIAEYNSTNTLQRRWVYDPDGQPVLWYEGSALKISVTVHSIAPAVARH